MDILLVARNTTLNRLVRKKTNSLWGHSSVVIDDIVYEFDFKNKSKVPLSSVISDSSISKATLFYAEMLGGDGEAEELYKELFDIGRYDIRALSSLRSKGPDGRDLENIQSASGLYTCSSLISKVCHECYEEMGLVSSFSKDIHWSQAIPDDYSSLEFRKDFVGN